MQYPDNSHLLNDLIERVNEQVFEIRKLASSQSEEVADCLENLAWCVDQAVEAHGDLAFIHMDMEVS